MEIFPFKLGICKDEEREFPSVQQLDLAISLLWAWVQSLLKTKIMNTAKEREEKHEEN